MQSMACGCGASAARSLSKSLTNSPFDGSRSTPSSKRPNFPVTCDVRKLAAKQSSAQTTTYGTMDERVLEDAVFSVNEECDSDDCSADDASEPEATEFPSRTRTCTLRDIPDPSQFMDHKWVSRYTKLFFVDDTSDADYSSDSDSEEESAAEGEEELPAVLQSDCEELHSDLLQPMRTIARRDFPAPREYLTLEELLLALKFYE
eukprot:TRINITY_DN14305_c0_g1_i1.p1 TRINITY_DN14305_c0_g1~~TRINITY_DN14305_c0_g1_i1.p1  ORF type:complete len:204 (-),score=30.73 TRINITY_DN14305_c0_g1_i1:228-839(-)